MIKEWIISNLLTKSNKVNNRIEIPSWWINRKFEQEKLQIIDKTNFLETDAPFNQRIYHILNDIDTIPTCHVCQSAPKPFKNFVDGYRSVCSFQCTSTDPNRIAKIISNSDYAAQKIKRENTCLKKYGTKHPQFLEKCKETKMRRYGNQGYNNMSKASETVISRYGVQWSSQIPSKIKKTQAVRDANIPLLRDSEWLSNANLTMSTEEISKVIGVSKSSILKWKTKHEIEDWITHWSQGSRVEDSLFDFIDSVYDHEIVRNDRIVIKPKEIDILLPGKGIGIEMNGVYWHREDPKRHKAKQQLCSEQQIDLIQFWDMEWYNYPDICKSIIKSRIGIKIGLFHDDNLVSLVGIAKSRFKAKGSHELIRAATKQNITVVGGLSKLLKYVDNNYEIDSLVTYCDRRLFSGNGYVQAGFTFSHRSIPNYFYANSAGRKLSRITCQKHKLKDLLDNFDSNLSESENMLNNKWFRVYDVGNDVYIKTK
jgi:hypothetical protein